MKRSRQHFIWQDRHCRRGKTEDRRYQIGACTLQKRRDPKTSDPVTAKYRPAPGFLCLFWDQSHCGQFEAAQVWFFEWLLPIISETFRIGDIPCNSSIIHRSGTS
jgi:hypothetical protein